jgi:hypothetical protein
MVMTKRTPSCDWIRMRLPLEIGPINAAAGIDPANGRGDEAPLDPRDRARIARHLDDCAGCRQHRAGLLNAMSALAAASSAFPIEPDAPSLWPSLERRIREHEQGLAPSSARSLASTRTKAKADARIRTRAKSTPRRLQNRLERFRDAAFEAIDETLDRCRHFLPEWEFRLRPGVVFGGLLTALIGGLVALQADRELTRSRIEISRQSGPIVSVPRTPPLPMGRLHGLDVANSDNQGDGDMDGNGDHWLWQSSSGTLITSTRDRDNSPEPSRSDLPGALAQAEIPANPRQSPAAGGTNSGAGNVNGSGAGTGAGSGSGHATGAGAMSAPSARYDFDLERGTPMSPDSRDAKLAY